MRPIGHGYADDVAWGTGGRRTAVYDDRLVLDPKAKDKRIIFVLMMNIANTCQKETLEASQD